MRAGVSQSPSSADDLNRLFGEAVGHFRERRFAEADALIGRLAAPLAGNAEFQRLRGLVATNRGDSAQALAAFEIAARLAPSVAAHHVNLGECHRLAGRAAKAIRSYRQARALDARAVPARITLAGLLNATGQRAEAMQEMERAVAAAGDDSELLGRIAFACKDLGAPDAAIRTMRRAVALRPGDFETEIWLRKLHTERVRAWHFAMMNDAPRNEAYDRAIRRAVTPQTHVLEIGTGSGLLALMAARAGARLVTSCEMVEVIAEAAAEIVQRNGYAAKVRVIPKALHDLVVGIDMPERADLLISEILSDELLGEDVLRSTEHARQQLLKPGARMIPSAIAAMIRLVGGPALLETVAVGTVAGFDLSPFNRFAPSAVAIKLDTRDFEDFSEDVEVFRFDLAGKRPQPEDKTLRLTATRGGTCAGVLQWVRLQLDPETVVENRPSGRFAAGAWRQMLFPFSTPVALEAGQTVALRARHNLVSLAFGLAKP